MLHARARRIAFEEAAAEAGLTATCLETDFSAAEGAAATERLLESRTPPTAIVYSNDHMAIAGLGVARRRGLSVPGDLSVTGFDDTEIGRYVSPSLTSVATDAREWGRVAARALLAAIAGGPPAHVRLAEPSLTVRESTGPAPTEYRGDRRDR